MSNRSGENRAVCHVCGALPHDPCIELVIANAYTGRMVPRTITGVHRGRMFLGGIKPWRAGF